MPSSRNRTDPATAARHTLVVRPRHGDPRPFAPQGPRVLVTLLLNNVTLAPGEAMLVNDRPIDVVGTGRVAVGAVTA